LLFIVIRQGRQSTDIGILSPFVFSFIGMSGGNLSQKHVPFATILTKLNTLITLFIISHLADSAESSNFAREKKKK